MTVYSALNASSVGIYAALNVSAVTTLATGGVQDDIAQATAYPFLLFIVNEKTVGGLGSQPGRSGFVSELTIRLHAFTQYEGGKLAQQVCDAAVGALLVAFDATSPTVTVTGYKVCDLVWTETSEPFDSIVAGVKVKEVVAQLTMRVQLS